MKKVLLLLLFANALFAQTQPAYHFDLLKDINTQTNDTKIVSIQNAGDKAIIFQEDRNYNDDTYKLRIWTYNGLKLENFASSDLFGEYAYFSKVVIIDDYLFFYATSGNGDSDNGLYVANLNSPVIKKVADATQMYSVVKLNGKFYYNARASFYGKGKLFYYNENTNESVEILGATQAFQDPVWLHVVNNQLFFTALSVTPIHQTNELWVSDGTSAGTHKVQELETRGNIDDAAVKLGNRVMFHGYNGNQTTLSISDGTEGGTYVFKDLQSFSNSPNAIVLLDRMYSFGDKVLLVLDGNQETQIWITDGTDANTKLMDNYGSVGFFDNGQIATKDGFVYYTNISGQLIKTDGTTRTVIGNGFAENTKMVLNTHDNCLYYFQSRKIYKTDGLTITMVSDKTMSEFLPIPFTVSANKIIAHFSPSENSMYGRELYSVTADSVTIVKDMDSTTKSSKTEFLLNAQGKSYFLAYDNLNTVYGKIFETDGTTEGIRGAEVGNLGYYHDFVAFRNDLYLLRNNQVQKVDFVNGNYQVINSLPGGITSQKSVQTNQKFYFITDGKTIFQAQLWASDGTTNSLTSIRLFDELDMYQGMAVYNQQLYVFTRGNGTTKIWKYTNDTSPPTLVKAINTYEVKRTYTNFQGKLAFINRVSDGTELWVTDGTEAGTKMLQYFYNLPPERMYFTDTHYYYSVYTYYETKVQVYKSDGTTAGKVLISNISNAYSDVTDFCQCNNEVFFGLNQAAYSGKSFLYKHNATSGSTNLVKETEELVETTKFKNFYCLNQWLYFTTYAGNSWETKKKLYTSNGTPEETRSILLFETKQEYSTYYRGGFLFPLNAQELLIRTDSRFYDLEWFTFRKCDNPKNLTGTTADSKIQSSSTFIESTEKLTGDGRVYYFAPKSITLKAGFSADNTNVFKAEIKNRTCNLRQ